MWGRIKNIFSRNSTDQLTLIELAKDSCNATFQEIGSLSNSVDYINKTFNTSSEILSNCFFELLAYYEFLVLIHLANILDLTDRSLSLYGGDLNVVYGQIAKDDAKLGRLIERAITDYQFHNLVSAYLSGDKSISGLSDERFFSLLKFLGFEKYHVDFMNRSPVVSYSRILNVLGCGYGDRDNRDIDIMLPTWHVHVAASINFRKLLAIKFKKAFPDSVGG